MKGPSGGFWRQKQAVWTEKERDRGWRRGTQRGLRRDSPNRKESDLLERSEEEAWRETEKETEFTEEERQVFLLKDSSGLLQLRWYFVFGHHFTG